ncbi:MAG: CHAD domain-containing protein, partial [Polyangiales bacterium]
ATAAEVAARVLTRLPTWTTPHQDWTAVEAGLRRVYRTGHRALAAAVEHPTVERLHELRKQSKYLWHALQLLEPAWIERDPTLGDRYHALSRLLGEDHDLAVLRAALAADPLTYGGHRALKAVFALVDRKRGDLQQRGIVLALELYRDSPSAFTARLAEHWSAWVASPLVAGAAPVVRASPSAVKAREASTSRA